MIVDNAWKDIMREGTTLAYLLDTISSHDKVRFDISIDSPIDEKRMNRDTERRLNRKGKE